MSAVDNAFILICSALVLFMTPGLALFYGGLVRNKNVLSSIMHSFFMIGLASVLWAVIGYSLAFGSSVGGFIGGLDFLMLRNVPIDDGSALSPMAFMIFQCMFAVITPALISGAYAERIKFTGFMIFSGLWLLLVYCPMAHMVWGGGIMAQMGALDFAGGAVVHMSSGAAAMAHPPLPRPPTGVGSPGEIRSIFCRPSPPGSPGARRTKAAPSMASTSRQPSGSSRPPIRAGVMAVARSSRR